MSTPRTPSKRNLARVPSMGSSFTSCFGASTPISPRRTGGHGLLGGQAFVNYRRLGFDDEDEDEHTLIYEAAAKEEEDAHGRYEHGKRFSSREEGFNAMHYTSEGEEHYAARERETVMKLGTPWSAMRESASMECFYASETPKSEEPYASEQEGDDEHVGGRKVTRKFAKLWSMREKDSISYASETPKRQVHHHAADEAGGVYVRERKGLIMKLAKLWTMREKGRRETCKEEHHASEESCDECDRERSREVQSEKNVCMREREGVYAGSPIFRRESLCRKVREACVQVLESARRSSPHLSELFVGNQLLMQVTSSSTFNARRPRNVAPSAGFLVTGDPPLCVVSPPRSSSASAF